MKKLKFLIIPLLIAMLLFSGINAFTEIHSKWSSGDLVYYDSANIFAVRNDTDGVKVYDDMALTFGDDGDATITYDETTDDALEITCANGITITAPLTFDGFIDWGTADAGIATTTASPFAMEVHTEPLTTLTAGDTGLSCGIRSRYHVSVAQANQISIGAIDARLRVKHALADGGHYGLNAGIEASGTDADFTGTATTMRSAAHLYLDFDADVTLADDGYLTILTLDNSVDDGMAGAVDNVQFAGIRMKEGSSGKQDLEHGIIIDDNVAVVGMSIGTCSSVGIDMNANTLTEAGGIQVNDDANVAFGTGSDVTVDWDNTRGALVTTPLGQYVSSEGLSDRFYLKWVAGQRGKPGINADIQEAAESTRKVTDNDFEVAGTAGSSDDITFYAEGGIAMETDGTDGNGVHIAPHLDANQSAWTQVTWGTDKETRWEADIKTGAAITTCIIFAGLKLTGVDVVATDDDQVFFRYEDGVNDGEWEAVNSIADSDDEHDTDVVVAANTVYHLVIEINSSRVATFYINGALVETSAALTTEVDFIPYISIEEDGASDARTLYVRGQAISRVFE